MGPVLQRETGVLNANVDDAYVLMHWYCDNTKMMQVNWMESCLENA